MTDLSLSGYPASYYAATARHGTELARLEGERRCDVCIVGAGYTGLSAALHLAQRGFDVVVLEAERVGWGASGRNGGQLHTGQRLDQMTLEAMFGEAHAQKLWTLAEDGKALVKSLITSYNIACGLKPGIIDADHRARFSAHSEAYAAHLHKKYGYGQISFLDQDALRGQLGTEAYFSGTLDWGAAHLHPLNFALGLAGAAQKAGAHIYERSRVTKVGNNGKHRIETKNGAVIADNLIIACNGYLDRLVPKIARRVMPIHSYILATEPLDPRLAEDIIRNDVAVADTRFVVNYFRLSEDKRMLFGGRESYGYGEPDDIASAVRKRMLSIYPQLDEVKIDYAWGGAIAVTMNRLPLVSQISSGVFTASGFSGHGLGIATLSGQILAEMIAGQAERFDVMSSLPIPQFPGGTSLRRPLLALGMLYYALRDRL